MMAVYLQGFLINLIFFLPYLGRTSFRVDQIVGALAAGVVAYRTIRRPLSGVTEDLKILFWGSFIILAWTFLWAFTTFGGFTANIRMVNSFAYLVEGISIYLLMQSWFHSNWRQFIIVSLIVSLVINGLALYMWLNNDNEIIRSILALYGGASNDQYGKLGTIAAITQREGRTSAIFAHPMALGVYDLTISSLALGLLELKMKAWEKIILGLSLFMSIIGGISTASKTWMLSFIIYMLVFMVISFPKFIRTFRPSPWIVAMTIGSYYAFDYFYQNSRFIRDWVVTIKEGNFLSFFSTRVGEGGYLVKTGTIKAAFEPINFLIGLGSGVEKYAWSDNGYIQVLIWGGIFFFILFHGLLLYQLKLHFKRWYDSRVNQTFILLMFVLFLAHSGVAVFLFPRATLFWVLVSMIVIKDIPSNKDDGTANNKEWASIEQVS